MVPLSLLYGEAEWRGERGWLGPEALLVLQLVLTFGATYLH